MSSMTLILHRLYIATGYLGGSERTSWYITFSKATNYKARKIFVDMMLGVVPPFAACMSSFICGGAFASGKSLASVSAAFSFWW